MAKRNRELRLLERRAEKQAKKDARKRAANGEPPAADPETVDDVERDSAPPWAGDQGDGGPAKGRERA